MQSFYSDDGRIRSNADGPDAIVFRSNDAGHVSSMPKSSNVLVEGKAWNEGRRSRDINLTVQINVRVIDAAIDNSHAHALSGVSSCPRCGTFHSFNVPLQIYEGLVAGRNCLLVQRHFMNGWLP